MYRYTFLKENVTEADRNITLSLKPVAQEKLRGQRIFVYTILSGMEQRHRRGTNTGQRLSVGIQLGFRYDSNI